MISAPGVEFAWGLCEGFRIRTQEGPLPLSVVAEFPIWALFRGCALARELHEQMNGAVRSRSKPFRS